MGVKQNRETCEWENWRPWHIQHTQAVDISFGDKPLIIMTNFFPSHHHKTLRELFTTPIHWKRFRECFTIYCMLIFSVMLTTQAHALTSLELDALVPVIVQAESSGRPDAVGDGGKARGLMQIQEATWKSMSKYPWDDAFDPNKNVQVGRAILEKINQSYMDFLTVSIRGVYADKQHILYTYNCGKYRFGELPKWTKNHPNRIYRRIFNEQ